MNRVLLTGGSGRLGRYVHTALVAQGFDVRNFDKVGCGSDVDQVQADILDRESLQSAMADRDMVIHLSLIHICRCRRYSLCRSRWSPYH